MGSLNPGSIQLAPTGRNLVTNGDAFVQQFGNGVGFDYSIAGAGPRFNCCDSLTTSYNALAATIADTASSDHPLFLSNGYSKSIQAVGAAVPAPAAASYLMVAYPIVYRDFFKTVGQYIAVSFWVKSPKSGIHYFGILGGGATNYVGQFAVTTANVWQYVQQTLLVPSTLGITNSDISAAYLIFPIVTGSARRCPAANVGTWSAGPWQTGPNQQNLLDAASATFKVTDVQLEIGTQATPYDRLPFNLQLQKCQYYYQSTFPYGTRPAAGLGLAVDGYVETTATVAGPSGAQALPSVPLIPSMYGGTVGRITIYNPVNANNDVRDVTAAVDCNSTAASAVGESTIAVQTSMTAGTVVGNKLIYHYAIGYFG